MGSIEQDNKVGFFSALNSWNALASTERIVRT
jgi:hypothetical protein